MMLHAELAESKTLKYCELFSEIIVGYIIHEEVNTTTLLVVFIL